jgi:hypothetical protein
LRRPRGKPRGLRVARGFVEAVGLTDNSQDPATF